MSHLRGLANNSSDTRRRPLRHPRLADCYRQGSLLVGAVAASVVFSGRSICQSICPSLAIAISMRPLLLGGEDGRGVFFSQFFFFYFFFRAGLNSAGGLMWMGKSQAHSKLFYSPAWSSSARIQLAQQQ